MTQTDSAFEFLDPGPLRDLELELVLTRTAPFDPVRGYVPCYFFEMRHVLDGAPMGHINLRVGDTPYLVNCAGHIGYGVRAEYRGRRYAARSCRLLLPLARRHGLDPLWITTNPDNWPSRRTCEIIGAEYVETIDVPPDTEMYRLGDRQKCRYRLDLERR